MPKIRPREPGSSSVLWSTMATGATPTNDYCHISVGIPFRGRRADRKNSPVRVNLATRRTCRITNSRLWSNLTLSHPLRQNRPIRGRFVGLELSGR